MSIIHVNHIKNQVLKLFSTLIDLSDLKNQRQEELQNFLLTRALGAYVIHYLSGSSPEDAANSITDGGDDNGIDAIFFDEPNKCLYLVQSKWINNGSGEPENGDVKKFVIGVRDLVNLRFERFNDKVRNRQSAITAALYDSSIRFEVVLVHTGLSNLSIHSTRDLNDLAGEFNDVSEVLSIKVLN